MISYLFPFLAGGLWGLSKLPLLLWPLGLLGIAFYFIGLRRLNGSWPLFAFAFSEVLVAQSWVFSTLRHLHPGSLTVWFYYLIIAGILSIPVFLGLWIVNTTLILVGADRDHLVLYRYLAFPLAQFIGLQLMGLFPLGDLPFPELSHHPIFRDWLSGAYPLVGSRGLEAILVTLFMLVILPFISKEEGNVLLSMTLVPLGILLFLGLLGSFPEKKNDPLQLAAMPWAGKLGQNPKVGAILKDFHQRREALGDKKLDLLLMPERAIPGFYPENQEILQKFQESLQPGEILLADRKSVV